MPPRSASVPPAPLLEAEPPMLVSHKSAPRSRAPSTPLHVTYPGFDQVGRGARRSDLIDRGFPLPEPTDPFDENQPMAWQGTLKSSMHYDPALKPQNVSRPTASRQMWKRINPGHMTQQWSSSQKDCQDEDVRQKQMKEFAFNAHLRKTDINMYANAYAIHYPKALGPDD